MKSGYQVMIFVNSRKDTLKTANIMRDIAQENNTLNFFDIKDHPKFDLFKKNMDKARSKELKQLFQYGFSVHHAGMLRQDRNLVEKVTK